MNPGDRSRFPLADNQVICGEDKLAIINHNCSMTVTYQDIAQRAFEIWEKEGRPDGQEQEDWFQAENELRKEQLKAQRGRKISSKDPGMMRPAKTPVL